MDLESGKRWAEQPNEDLRRIARLAKIATAVIISVELQ
jgi:hypothetical protein